MVFGSYRLGGRFVQLSNFIVDIEKYVPHFYATIGQNLSQWKRPAPKISQLSEEVDVDGIARDAEQF